MPPRIRRRILDLACGALAGAGALALWSGGSAGVVEAREFRERSDAPEIQMATGTTAAGGALLFVLNTRTESLVVYEAEGGTRATRGLTFVGARKIARDVYVTGYNDKSEYTYQELLERFDREAERVKSEEAPAAAGGR